MPAPIPSWDGVTYVDSRALPTFRSGDGVGETGPPLEPVTVWLRDATVEHLDIANTRIGDALDPSDDERGAITIPLMLGTNVVDGVETPVHFFLHDVSDETLAEELGIAWAGALANTPAAALGGATVDNGHWTFHGDLPNPIPAMGSPPQDDANTYTPLRLVQLNGKQVVVNAVFVSWGDEPWEHMRIDHSCVGFPDEPPNTTCAYNGTEWGGFEASGHALAINTGVDPSVTLKPHKSWAEEGDYLPYYVVLDSYPAGPANAMGVPYVPKHAHLGTVAVPLVQFLPPAPLNDSFPPTPAEWLALSGGGPLGGQIGIPSYFMPESDYSPMWHIGFARWLDPASEVVKSLDRIKELRSSGQLEINEFPPIVVDRDDYDFTNANSPHVVNCPVPLTVDGSVHEAARRLAGVP